MTDAVELGLTNAQADEFRRILTAACEPLRRKPPQLMSEWADEHFYLSAESSGTQGRWQTVHFQKGVLDMFGNDDIQTVDVFKSARMGYTKMTLISICYNTTHRMRSTVLYQPTDTDALDFMKTEVETVIRDIPEMTGALVGGDKQGKHNTTTIKSFHGCQLHVLGGKSPRAFRRLTKDIVIYDELDGFDRDIGGEGSPVSLGDARITASPVKKSIRGTTPGIAGDSHIEDCVENADEQFRYHPKCLECGELVPFGWRHISFTDRDPSTACAACDACGTLWEFRDHYRLMSGGRWISDTGMVLEPDGTFSREGETVPAPKHVAVHMWSGISPFITWSELVEEFLRAKGNPLLLKSFTNTRLGELWVEQGESVDAGDLAVRAEQYEAEAPDGVRYVTAGVDVQADRFEIQFCGWGDGEECWSLAYERIFGDLSRREVWDVLEKSLARGFLHSSGAVLPTGIVGVDSGYLPDKVYDFCRRDVTRLIPTKGQLQGPIIHFPRKKSREKVYLTPVGTDQAKNLIYARLKSDDPRMYHWPRNAEHDADYFKQLTAEEKRRTYQRGHEVFRWWKAAGARNEVLDCNVYALAAVRIAQTHFGVNLSMAREDPPQKAAQAASGGEWVRDSGDDWI